MGISASQEDYLEAILVLQNQNQNVRGKDIAEYLDIKRPSVTDAIKLLKNKQLVSQERFGFIELTAKGKKHAKDVFKKHLLIKEFLQNTLGIDEQTADNDACKIEHSLSNKTIEKMREYMK